MHDSRAGRPAIPLDSRIFGYGPMLPFVAGALACWFVPRWSGVAVDLTIIWGALILAFLGGVRRGFGFGDPAASTRAEILTMMVYVSLGGLALILATAGSPVTALAVLAAGYIVVPIADTIGAAKGDVPAYFAALRPKQMSIAIVSLLAILVKISLS
ncbi:DUF3429 domain-containing protein [Novosphingobium lindaniclasticum]|nr:DUF3429 domain-containing protein [Novosphingobium lindaniclasticum]